MEETMVERVAQAMTDAFDRMGRVFDDGQAEALARAAIEAMKLPLPEPPGAKKQSIGQAALRMMVKP